MHRLVAFLCPTCVTLASRKKVWWGRRAGMHQSQPFHYCVHIIMWDKKGKIMFKTLLKVAGMLFLLTLHKNDSLFSLQLQQNHKEGKYVLVQ